MNNKDDKKQGIIKRSFKSMINVRRWIAWDEVIGSGKNVISLAKDLLKTPKKRQPTTETFEEVVAHANLTEEEIVKRTRVNLHLTIIYLVMAFGLFMYMIYSLWSGRLLATFISLILGILVLSYALRTHLIYIQMKHRKVCRTFTDFAAISIG
jgi:hypothetical protein